MDASLPDLRDAISSRLSFAIEIARRAGGFTLELFRSETLAVEHKKDASPVTAADRGAEQLIRAALAEAYPEDGVFGEEFPPVEGSNDFCWVLDPIDGTKSFIHGVPLYTTLIGLLYQNQPVLGVIYAPALDEMVYASQGQGAWTVRNGGEALPAKIRSCSDFSEALFLTSETETFDEIGRWELYGELDRRCRIARTWGDGYGYLLLATGRADLMMDPIVSLWDVAAIMPVITEAGGIFTDFAGEATPHSGNCFAASQELHPQVLALLQEK